MNANAKGNDYWGQAMVQQTLGGFLLVFVYLTQTEAGYKLSQDPAITTMIISGCYIIAMYIGFSLAKPMMVVSSLNPAVSLGMIVAVVFKPGRGVKNSGMDWAWIYLVFPWLGAVIAVVVYELLFKKAQDVVQEHEEQEELEAEAHLID